MQRLRLSTLLILDGERLSYRTLDVEQIGSVYETMMGFDDEYRVAANDAARFAEDHFDQAWVFLQRGGDFLGVGRRYHSGKLGQTAFGFGGDFLRDYQDIAVFKRHMGAAGGGEDFCREVVVFLNFGQAGDREELEGRGTE